MWSIVMGFPGGSLVKNLTPSAGDSGSIPGSGRSPAEGNGNTVQYSCLRIPWTEEPGGLQPVWLQRVGHNWVTEHIHTKHIQKAKSHLVPKRAAIHKSEQMWVKSPHSWPRVGVLLLWRLVVPKQMQQEGQAEEGGDALYLYMIHVTVQQKPTPHGKAIILQLKIK